ncbi:MAG: hypothetical protein N2257_01795 [Thermodesulfovibrionales bacterium]|nr:hypothetical protein [Thermodesulfovibrionales bacterium]
MARILFIDIDKEFNIIISEKNRRDFKVLRSVKLKKEEFHRIKAEMNSGLSGLKTPRCYISLPLSNFNFRIVELPFREEDKIREVLPFELKEKIIEPLENFVWDFLILPSEKEDTQRVLVVYTKKDELTSLLRTLSDVGITPDVISSFSLRYVIEKGLKTEDLLNPPDYKDHLPELIRKESEKPLINLLKGGLGITLERENILKRIKITNVLLILLLSVLILAYTVSIRRNYSETERLRALIAEEYRKEFPQERIKDELLQLKSHLKEIKEKKDILTGIPVTELLKKIKPSGAITIDSVDIDSRSITIKGESRDLAGIEAFKEKLKEGFRNPAILESGQFLNKFRFTIKAER